MHITKLIVQNIKGIKAIRIEPNGNMVVLSGKNGQGKTSVLDAIWLAVQGAAASKGTPSPLRRGTKSGFVEVHLGDLVIRRTWKEGKTTRLVVKNAGVVVKRSPQKMLDDLIGRLSFDPLAFDKLKGADQRAMLLGLVVLGFDPDKLEAKRVATFSRRTDANRDVKRLEAQLAGMPEPAVGTPAKEVSVGDLIEQHDRAKEAQANATRLRRERTDALEAMEDAREEVARAELAFAKASSDYADIPKDLADPAKIKARIDSAAEVNTAVRSDQAWAATDEQLTATRNESDKLTAELEAIDEEKTVGLLKAKMPVEGLGFTADGVTYNGSPFEQVSGAERWRICMAIAMALNPALRVIRITEGSLLDAESRALLEATVIKHKFQCWMECVSDGGGEGFVIEDGEIAETEDDDGDLFG